MKQLTRIACAVWLLIVSTGTHAAQPGVESAVFAGGCFWCVEADFDKLDGVRDTVSGYSGGPADKATYEQTSRGGTGHAESVQVQYDPAKISYVQLLDYFWHHIDPTVKDRQFCDSGSQYRSVIFYANAAQKKAAEESKAKLVASGRFKNIYTEVVPLQAFYAAEQYHQDYYRKNPLRYKYYRLTCGRDARVHELWGEKN